MPSRRPVIAALGAKTGMVAMPNDGWTRYELGIASRGRSGDNSADHRVVLVGLCHRRDPSQGPHDVAQEDVTLTTLSIRRTRRLLAASAAAALIFLIATGAALAGNNGTLKIHEQGTPDGTPNNDPKVCTFNVEAFNLDAGQTGYLVFEVQGGDAPQGVDPGTTYFEPADSTGHFASEYFSPPAGHYKATLYGKADLTDVKAKSKVFKVTCVGGSWSGDGGPTT